MDQNVGLRSASETNTLVVKVKETEAVGCVVGQAVWSGLHLLSLSDRKLPGSDDHAAGGRLASFATADLRWDRDYQRQLGFPAPRDAQRPSARKYL